MKITKTIMLWVLFILMVGMIGCSNGSSSGGSTTTTTSSNTSPLVGTWNPDGGGVSLTFKADGTGYLSDGVHDITDWTLNSSNVLNLKLNGTPEIFQLTWKNDAKTTMSLENIGPNSNETTDYTKS